MPSFAQRNTGTFVGLVADSTGAAIPDAVITVTNLDTGVLRTEVAEKTGNYRVVLLPPGRYKVSAAAAGFAGELREVAITHGDCEQYFRLACEVLCCGLRAICGLVSHSAAHSNL